MGINSMNLEYIPVSSGLSSPTDSLIIKGKGYAMYNSINQLLNIGYEMLGQDSFRTKEEMLQDSFTEYTDRLAEYILQKKPKNFRELCVLYFSFWEENMEFLDRLRKADILYKFGDSFEELVHQMAGRIKHQNRMSVQEYQRYLEQYKFHFAYRTAGFWRVTELWSGEKKRQSAAEMAEIMVEIANGKSVGPRGRTSWFFVHQSNLK